MEKVMGVKNSGGIFVKRSVSAAVLLILVLCSSSLLAIRNEIDQYQLNLSDPTLIVVCSKSAKAEKAGLFLSGEIAKRSKLKIGLNNRMPKRDFPVIVIGRFDDFPAEFNFPKGLELKPKAESFCIWTDATGRTKPTIYVVGIDDRGVLYGVGMLLRKLNIKTGSVTVDGNLMISSSPAYKIRGHQLGYRSLNNAYDKWTVKQYEQYIRELAMFGVNTIELLPGTNPDRRQGYHMVTKPWDMNMQIIGICNEYGLDIGIWQKIYMKEIDTPEKESATLARWKMLFESIEGLDYVFVPGGDGGDLEPERMMDWLGKVSVILRKAHPEATLWVSNQTYDADQNRRFFEHLSKEKPDFLEGVVYGPWTTISLDEVRRRLDSKYRLRRYPDICHCLGCQYPVDKWDRALSQFHGREPVCPRPTAMRHIHNKYAPLTDGFVTYSDGVNDDFNKFLWSALAWDPSQSTEQIANEYGRAFFGYENAKSVELGILALEQNWVGPLAENDGVDRTLRFWERLYERTGTEPVSKWRAQMYLFRATYDSYLKDKGRLEAEFEAEAYDALEEAKRMGVERAILKAKNALNCIDKWLEDSTKRKKLKQLGIELFESIGYQLSVAEPFKAIGTRRGAVLDFIDRPSNNRLWLQDQFAKILAESDKAKQLAMIDRLINWENPGKGGFYDDTGCAWKSPHVVRDFDWSDYPSFTRAAIDEQYYTEAQHHNRQSWQDQAQIRYGMGHTGMMNAVELAAAKGRDLLKMRYEGLDGNAQYMVRVTYNGRFTPMVKLWADGKYQVHPAMMQPDPVWPVEFDVPKEATADGKLQLSWEVLNKARGAQVAEVWLIKK
jgi:hypothetical protein